MSRLFCLGCLVVSLFHPLSAAFVPPADTVEWEVRLEEAEVIVHVSVTFNNGCVGIEDWGIVSGSSPEYLLNIRTREAPPGSFCAQSIRTETHDFNLGALGNGTYSVTWPGIERFRVSVSDPGTGREVAALGEDPASPYEAGLTAYFTFDLPEARDAVGGELFPANQVVGSADSLYFGGTRFSGDHRIELGPSRRYETDSAFTFAFWAKQLGKESNDAFVFLSNYNGGRHQTGYFWFQHINTQDNPPELVVFVSEGSLVGGAMGTVDPITVELGEWHHYALTYDNSETGSEKWSIFLDGVELPVALRNEEIPSGLILNRGNQPLFFGRNGNERPPSGGEGEVDELGIWNGRALNAEEIGWLYNGGAGRFLGDTDADGDGLATREESSLGTNPLLIDTDGDRMPDGWESTNGTNPLVADGALDKDGDGLSNEVEYQRGTDPCAADPDSDGDGLADAAESFFGADPAVPDTDGDGVVDGVEVANGMDPAIPDAGLDLDEDGLSNIEELELGTRLDVADSDSDGLSDGAEQMVHGTNAMLRDSDGDGFDDGAEISSGLNALLPESDGDFDLDWVSNAVELRNGTDWANPDSSGTGTSDYEELTGKTGKRHRYDEKNRLVGSEASSGLSIFYGYDANGNPTQERWLPRDGDRDGLLDLDEMIAGLDPDQGGEHGRYGDLDGDGWSNLQELEGVSAVNDSRDAPIPEEISATMTMSEDFGWAPERFVAEKGVIDKFGETAVLIVGADGTPGPGVGVTLKVFSLGSGAVSLIESIPLPSLGDVGVVSIATGRPAGTSGNAIFVGTREAGGGRVYHVEWSGTAWVGEEVARSLDESVKVSGVLANGSLLIELSEGAIGERKLFGARRLEGAWILAELDANQGHEAGEVLLSGTRIGRWLADGVAPLELVDFEGRATIVEPPPAGAIYWPNEQSYYLRSPNAMSWTDARAWARGLGGDLVTVNSQAENDELVRLFRGSSVGADWIGLYQENKDDEPAGGWVWSDGSAVDFLNWYEAGGQPNDVNGDRDYACLSLQDNFLSKRFWIASPLDNPLREAIAEFKEARNPLMQHPGSSSLYRVESAPVDWLDMVSHVDQYGAFPTQIESDNENAFVSGLLNSGETAWIGLSRTRPGGSEAFRWLGDSPSSFRGFPASQPDNDNHFGISINGPGLAEPGDWDDRAISETRPVVNELNLEEAGWSRDEARLKPRLVHDEEHSGFQIATWFEDADGSGSVTNGDLFKVGRSRQDLGVGRGLLAYWPAEAPGDLQDATQSRDSLQPIRPRLPPAPGMRGTALSFDGVDGVVGAPDLLVGFHSVSLWFRASALPGVGQHVSIVSLASDTQLGGSIRLGDGKLRSDGLWGNDSVLADFTDTEEWHHLVVSRGPEGIRVFLDGLLLPTPTPVITDLTSFRHLVLGAEDWTGTGSLFEGQLDEIGVWSRQLEEAEVEALYRGGNGLFKGGIDDAFRARATLLEFDSATQRASHASAAIKFDGDEVRSVIVGRPDGALTLFRSALASEDLVPASFSGEFVGNEWHELLICDGSFGRPNLVGISRDPAAPTEARLVLWENPVPPPVIEVPQSAPIARVTEVSGRGSAMSLTLRLWDAEGNRSTAEVQYSTDGTSWIDAAKLTVDGTNFAGNELVAPPTGESHQLTWDSTGDLGLGFNGLVFLRARATDVTLTGDWSAATPVQVAEREFDLWVKARFPSGMWSDSTKVGPLADADWDTLETVVEYGLDTDPLDPGGDNGPARSPAAASDAEGHLTLTFRCPENGRSDLRYTIEMSPDGETWRTVATRERNAPWVPSENVTLSTPAVGLVTVTVHDDTVTTAPARKFGRLKVELLE